MPSKRRRLRFRFSMRTLVLFLLIVGCLAAWFGNRIRRGQQQYRSGIALVDTQLSDILRDVDSTSLQASLRNSIWKHEPGPPLPAWVLETVGEHTFSSITGISLGREVKDSDLQHLSNLFSLKELSIYGKAAERADAILESAAKIRSLKYLRLTSSKVTDVGIAHLANSKRLHTLWIDSSNVTDESLVSIANLHQLRELSLAKSAISDGGLRHLGELQEIRRLKLRETRVTAQGLQHLAGLRKLESLDLTGCDIQFRDAVNFFVKKQDRSVHEVLVMLGHLSDKDELSLQSPGINDDDVHLIVQARNVRSLHFSQELISDAGLKKLVDSFPDLQRLQLSSPNITDDGLRSLVVLKKLNLLYIDRTSASKAGIEDVQRLMPWCDVLVTSWSTTSN